MSKFNVENLVMRNGQEAFENAIKKGMKNPKEWMYMYSSDNKDYFKHINTREYTFYLIH